MTDIERALRIEGIKARVAKATPGPWERLYGGDAPKREGEPPTNVRCRVWQRGSAPRDPAGPGREHASVRAIADLPVVARQTIKPFIDLTNPRFEDDAEFIAKARTDIPWLLEQLATADRVIATNAGVTAKAMVSLAEELTEAVRLLRLCRDDSVGKTDPLWGALTDFLANHDE